jgi:hypothetical protein
MTHASIVQRAFEVAEVLEDPDGYRILSSAARLLDLQVLAPFDGEGDDDAPLTHLIGLCKDGSIFFISIKPQENSEAETWEIFSFPDALEFEKFLHHPLGEKHVPPATLKALLSSYSKLHLIQSLEPGHA